MNTQHQASDLGRGITLTELDEFEDLKWEHEVKQERKRANRQANRPYNLTAHIDRYLNSL